MMGCGLDRLFGIITGANNASAASIFFWSSGSRGAGSGTTLGRGVRSGEVGQRSGKAVYLINHHHVDALFPDVFEQGFQGRSIHCRPGKSAVVVCGLDQPPTLTGLTLDERC